jgi:hypothetical protein
MAATLGYLCLDEVNLSSPAMSLAISRHPNTSLLNLPNEILEKIVANVRPFYSSNDGDGELTES